VRRRVQLIGEARDPPHEGLAQLEVLFCLTHVKWTTRFGLPARAVGLGGMSLLAARVQALQVLVDQLLELGASARLTVRRPATAKALAALEKAWKAPVPGSLQALQSLTNGLELKVEANEERVSWSFGSAEQLAKRKPAAGKVRLAQVGVDVTGAVLSVGLSSRKVADPPLRSSGVLGPTVSAFLDLEVARLEGLVRRLRLVRTFPAVSLQQVEGERVGFAQVQLGTDSTLTPLLGLSVKELSLSRISTHDLTPLASMPSLRQLELRFDGAARIPRLAVSFPSVQRLVVSVETLDDLGWLGRFPSVTRLKLRAGTLPATMDLSGFTLDHLCLTGFFSSQRPRALKRLCLPRAARLLELKSLDVEHLPTIEGGDGLQQLVVHDLRLAAVTMPELPGLQDLLISGNGLTALTSIERAPSLTRLDVSRNRLERIEVERLTSLRQFDVSENELTEVPRLPASIVEVGLQKNRLRSFEALRGLGRDVTVDLRGNGVTPKVRLQVERALGVGPRLRWLDES
jgi:Leucine-rich repeat (LRR) protein